MINTSIILQIIPLYDINGISPILFLSLHRPKQNDLKDEETSYS